MDIKAIQEIGTLLASSIGGWIVAMVLWRAYQQAVSRLEKILLETSEAAQRRYDRLTDIMSATRPTLSDADRQRIADAAQK